MGQLQAVLESGFQAGDTHRPVAADVSPDGTWRPPPASLRVTVNLIAVSECGFPAVGQAAQHLPPRDAVVRVHRQNSPRSGLWGVLRFSPLSTVALKKMPV